MNTPVTINHRHKAIPEKHKNMQPVTYNLKKIVVFLNNSANTQNYNKYVYKRKKERNTAFGIICNNYLSMV